MQDIQNMQNTDLHGIPLTIGELVVFSGTKAYLKLGTIIGFTPKKIKIEYTEKGYNRIIKKTCTKFPGQIAAYECNKQTYPEYFI